MRFNSNNVTRKNMSILAVALLTSLLAYCAYLRLSYIDNVVTQGTAYGFLIGDSKEKSFHKARNVFEERRVYILHPIDKRGFGPRKRLEFNNDDYEILMKREKWEIYYDDKSFYDSITLTFAGEALVEIYRHRKKIELP